MVFVRHHLTAVLAVALLAALAPTTASAAVDYRCAASAVSGSVLGQPLPVPTAGSTTKPCADDSTLPTLSLPALLTVDAVNGVTSVTDAGVFAAGGLGNVRLGSIPVALPLPDIAIPAELTKVEVSLPVPVLGTVPVATVDLTPAITAALDALKSRDSKALLDVGVAYASAYGTCSNGAPTLGGGARVADASVLGLPLDLSQATDRTLTAVDTSTLALSALDLTKVDVTTLGVIDVGVLRSEIIAQVQSRLATLPPVAIPAQLAQVKVTPPSQELTATSVFQRGPRVQISLLGTPVADVAIGAALVSANGRCEAGEVSPEADCPRCRAGLHDPQARAHRRAAAGSSRPSLRRGRQAPGRQGREDRLQGDGPRRRQGAGRQERVLLHHRPAAAAFHPRHQPRALHRPRRRREVAQPQARAADGRRARSAPTETGSPSGGAWSARSRSRSRRSRSSAASPAGRWRR